ncbi:hypothetical protein MSAS_51490 [Mycobacterium saskatchewanense]|nr:nuclear transport factor 2 family protein [Mycobacterium saskatchewanense]BBX65975.1 hypothetical protein MSAS_51490 [Mycobacterium saskatchewanense]
MISARELMRAHIRNLQNDFAAWRALFADDAVMEFAFGASAGVASPCRGIDEIAASVKGFLDSVQDFKISGVIIYQIEGDDAVIAEFSGTANVAATGRTYNQDYIVYLRAQDGKIIHVREYFDPARTVAAFRA